MGSSENLCVKWDAFEANISKSFNEFRENSLFFDVTLCCDNGIDIIPAHKVILAACSPLFRKILSHRENQQSHFLYLKGIHLKELRSLLDLIYYGEVDVPEESLNDFLEAAEELSVKGLAKNSKKTQNRKIILPPGLSIIPKTSKDQTPSLVKDTQDKNKCIFEDSNIKDESKTPEFNSEIWHDPPMDEWMEEDIKGTDVDENRYIEVKAKFEEFGQHGNENLFDESIGKFNVYRAPALVLF